DPVRRPGGGERRAHDDLREAGGGEGEDQVIADRVDGGASAVGRGDGRRHAVAVDLDGAQDSEIGDRQHRDLRIGDGRRDRVRPFHGGQGLLSPFVERGRRTRLPPSFVERGRRTRLPPSFVERGRRRRPSRNA